MFLEDYWNVRKKLHEGIGCEVGKDKIMSLDSLTGRASCEECKARLPILLEGTPHSAHQFLLIKANFTQKKF